MIISMKARANAAQGRKAVTLFLNTVTDYNLYF